LGFKQVQEIIVQIFLAGQLNQAAILPMQQQLSHPEHLLVNYLEFSADFLEQLPINFQRLASLSTRLGKALRLQV
jgi:uncharacterized membrane protein